MNIFKFLITSFFLISNVYAITIDNPSIRGNMGIGTTNPGQVVDIVGNVRLRGTNELIFGDDNNAGILASTGTNGDLKFGTNNIEVMRITNGGNVGIGSLAPGSVLDVVGTIRANGYSAGTTPGITSATCTHWTNGLCDHI